MAEPRADLRESSTLFLCCEEMRSGVSLLAKLSHKLVQNNPELRVSHFATSGQNSEAESPGRGPRTGIGREGQAVSIVVAKASRDRERSRLRRIPLSTSPKRSDALASHGK